DGASGELMHEGGTLPFGVISQYDEYFVPIPVKCFGDPNSAFWQQCASSTGKERLRELAGHWARRFPEGFQPETAKAEVGPNFGEVRMNLADDRVGYYELLQTATKATQGAQNILIGYSQGGTVARYLAFLDEYVAAPEYRCIHTIITAQSPNRGSPVASRAKSMEVSRALFAVLLSVAKWLPDGFRKQPIWTDLAKHCSNDALLKFVNDLLD